MGLLMVVKMAEMMVWMWVVLRVVRKAVQKGMLLAE